MGGSYKDARKPIRNETTDLQRSPKHNFRLGWYNDIKWDPFWQNETSTKFQMYIVYNNAFGFGGIMIMTLGKI